MQMSATVVGFANDSMVGFLKLFNSCDRLHWPMPLKVDLNTVLMQNSADIAD